MVRREDGERKARPILEGLAEINCELGCYTCLSM